MIGADAAYNLSADRASGLETQPLFCRAQQHDWIPATARRYKGGFETEENCSHGCGCTRVRTFDKWGFVQWSHIHYPTGYLFSGTGNHRGHVKAAARLELLERSIIDLKNVRKLA